MTQASHNGYPVPLDPNGDLNQINATIWWGPEEIRSVEGRERLISEFYHLGGSAVHYEGEVVSLPQPAEAEPLKLAS